MFLHRTVLQIVNRRITLKTFSGKTPRSTRNANTRTNDTLWLRRKGWEGKIIQYINDIIYNLENKKWGAIRRRYPIYRDSLWNLNPNELLKLPRLYSTAYKASYHNSVCVYPRSDLGQRFLEAIASPRALRRSAFVISKETRKPKISDAENRGVGRQNLEVRQEILHLLGKLHCWLLMNKFAGDVNS